MTIKSFPIESQQIYPLIESALQQKERALGRDSLVSIECVIDVKAKEICAPVNKDALQKILLSFFDRGIDQMDSSAGTLTLTLSLKNEEVCLNVTASGRALSESEISQLLKLSGEKGLAEENKVISAWGGTIEIKSTKGKGTTFSIWLPAFDIGTRGWP